MRISGCECSIPARSQPPPTGWSRPVKVKSGGSPVEVETLLSPLGM